MSDPQGHTNLVRFLPVAGVAMALITVLGFVGILSASKAQALALLAGLATLPYGGKEAALPVGMAAGANPLLLGTFVFLVDAAAVCFLYPPIHYAIKRWMDRDNLAGAYLRYVRRKSLEKRGLVTRYGTAGLFVFMLVPFAINGPLVGAVLGRLMGLRARQIVPALMAAIGVTTVAWTAAYSFGFMVVSQFDKNLPKWIAAVVILIVIIHAGVAFYRLRREEGGGGDEVEAPSAPSQRPVDRANAEPA